MLVALESPGRAAAISAGGAGGRRPRTRVTPENENRASPLHLEDETLNASIPGDLRGCATVAPSGGRV